MSREHILNGVYVSETGTRSEILAPEVYLNETVATGAVTPTPDNYWQSPLRTISKVALIASGLISPIVQPPTEIITADKWFKSLTEPLRITPGLNVARQRDFFAEPRSLTLKEAVTEDRWHQPWSEPVRSNKLKIALTASGLIAPVLDPNRQITQTLMSRWYLQWSDPVRRISTPQHYEQPSWSLFQIPTVVTTGWLNNLSEPVRKLENRIGIRDRYPFFASAVHIGWFEPLSEPVPRAKGGLIAASQQAFAFNPLPFPAVTVNIGWFNNLSDPVRRISPTPTDQQFIPRQPIIPSFGWYGGFVDPVRRIRKASPSEQPSWSLFQEPSPVISFGWHDPLSEPVRVKEDKIGLRVKYPFIYGSVYMSWFSSLSEPIRIRVRLNTAHQQALAFYPFPLPPPITVDNLSWFNNLSNPVRRIRPTPTDQQFTQYQPIIPYSWLNNLSDPTRRKIDVGYLQDNTEWIAISSHISWFVPLEQPLIPRRFTPRPYNQISFAAIVPQAPSFGWFEGFTDPSRRVRIAASLDSQNFVFQVTPAVIFGWFGSLNEPTRRKPSPISWDQDFSPFPQVSFGWFGGLSEPVRKTPRVAWTDHISFQFPIVPFSWFNRLDDPTLPKNRVIAPPYFSFSPSPIQLSFGWYGGLTEPVRVKPKALQQIFGVVPEFTQPFFYLAALNTTEQRDFFFAVLYQFNPPLRAYVDIIEKDPRHRGNLGIIEPAAEPSIIASIVPQSASATGGTPVPTVAGARVAIITS